VDLRWDCLSSLGGYICTLLKKILVLSNEICDECMKLNCSEIFGADKLRLLIHQPLADMESHAPYDHSS
jgi:hypothetical protein